MNAAAAAAEKAFASWREISVMSRQQVMFKLQSLIRDNMVGLIQLSCDTPVTIHTGRAGKECDTGAREDIG